MKEMIYKSNFDKLEILAQGIEGRYEWLITSTGMHPCAYIKLPKNHPYTGLTYDNEEINSIPVHGGATYTERYYPTDEQLSSAYNWVLGWDYAHYNDYSGSYLTSFFGITFQDCKKWATQEIKEEVLKVIHSLKTIKRRFTNE